MNATRKRAPVVVNPIMIHPLENRMKLDGGWGFKLDPDGKGLDERWYDSYQIISEDIKVPGTWQGQGFGSDGKYKVWDFNIEARTFRAVYEGAGWYCKTFAVPESWRSKRIWVNFGGVHPSADIWLNGIKLGENHAPFVPFGFEITDIIRLDGDNVLVVRVYEKAREFGLAYNWQGNWSGLYRDVELTATGDAYIDRLMLYPDVDSGNIKVKARIGGFDPPMAGMDLKVSARPAFDETGPAYTSSAKVEAEQVELDIKIPTPALWSPDDPNLYIVEAVLDKEQEVLDAVSDRTGFVKFTMKGKHFMINGQPYYMRGHGDFISCPETGCPDFDRDRWRKKLKALREFGYNYVRLQSYAYGPEYYDVADEMGLIVQSEMGMLGAWGTRNIWHDYQWPLPTSDNREQLKWQWDHVVMRDVNHPSASIYCMSNEWHSGTFHTNIAWKCYYDTKAIKPGALVIWTDGGYNEELPGDFVNEEAWFDEKCDKPVIQHEFRWWSSFPDIRNRHKYKGAIRPWAAEMALDAATRHGIAHTLSEAAVNSQKLQFIEAKAKMEGCRRDYPRLAGICHFSAVDFNPSPQGILDDFYEVKYADSKTWLQTNGDTVILSGLKFDDRIYQAGDAFMCSLSVSDFSHPPLKNPVISWRITSNNGVIASGDIEYDHEPYKTCNAGNIEAALPCVSEPLAASVEVMLKDGDRQFTNKWDIWIFPGNITPPQSTGIYGKGKYTWVKGIDRLPFISIGSKADAQKYKVVISETLDATLLEYILSGGRVVLAATECMLRPSKKEGHYFFTPPANYPTYEDGHNGTIIKQHPMLGKVPHEGFADWQFFRMISGAPPIDLEPLGLSKGDPIIRAIHRYPSGRSLGYLVECSLGKGGLVITSLNLDQSLIEARYLLAMILTYAAGDGFKPGFGLTKDEIEPIIKAAQWLS